MQEATQPAVEKQPLLYDFSLSEIIIPINVRPNSAKPLIVQHKLRKPTFAELEARDRKQTAESVTHGNEEVIEGAGSGPDLELWGKLILGVQGYGYSKEKVDLEWLEAPETLKTIPVAHKLAAIRALHDSEYDVVVLDEDADVFVIGGTEVRVKQTIGSYEIIHTLREMSEEERLDFERKSMRASFVRGKGKDVRTKIQPNLKAHVDLYDKLIMRLEGATTGGNGFAERNPTPTERAIGYGLDAAAIDAIFKRGVINAMLTAQAAIVSD